MKIGSEYYFYHNDHLGTPQKMTAVNGAVVWAARYDSFGKADVDAGSMITNNLRFPGQYFDSESGLHYNFYRYYDAEIGRYGKKDPIGFWGNDANLYNYVWSNPIIFHDVLGLMGNRSDSSEIQRQIQQIQMRMRAIRMMRDEEVKRWIRRLRQNAKRNPGGDEFEHTACCYNCGGRTVCEYATAQKKSSDTTGTVYETDITPPIERNGKTCCKITCMHVHENQTENVGPSGNDYMPPSLSGPDRPFIVIGMGDRVAVTETGPDGDGVFVFDSNDSGRSYRQIK